MRMLWVLSVAAFKMYFREREAIIWTFLFPLMVIILFSFVNFGGLGHVNVGVVVESAENSATLLSALQRVDALHIEVGERAHELALLEKGDRDMVLVIPAWFSPGAADEDSTGARGDTGLIAYTNQEKVQQTQLGSLLIQKVMDELTFERTPVRARARLFTQPVKSRSLNYIDFLLPGVLSMSIMQMGIFGVAFGFVSLKKRGILRRLSATPIRPSDFIVSQVAMRVAVLMMQVVLMVGVGLLFLNFHFAGNLFSMFLIAFLGAVVFLGFGFALAGISSSENQVAPLANVITLPMLLLSGVFFSRASLPGFLRLITDFLPLTFLVDGLRSVAIDAASLPEVGVQLLGLAVWAVLSVFTAVKLFRWE